MRYREVSKRLRKLGCYEIRRPSGGSHRKWIKPETNGLVIIPNHGSKDLVLAVVRRAVRDLDIPWQKVQGR